MTVGERVKACPLEAFVPHEKQREFLSSHARTKLFVGGNRSGKTTCGVVEMLIQALSREHLPDHLLPYKRFEPPFFCRVMTPDLVDTQEHVIFPKIREWCPPGALKGGSWRSAYSDRKRTLEFENGSRVHFMSFEQALGKMGGSALHCVWYDEEPPEEVRSENRARLWDYGGYEMLTMTPLQGLTWVYDQIYIRRHEPGIFVVEVDVEDNRHNLSWREVEQSLAELSPEERAARKSGVFVPLTGLIYGREWDRKTHVVRPHPLPTNRHVIVGIDPGIRFGAGVVWACIDQNGTIIVFDELQEAGWTIGELCQKIHETNQRWGVDPDMYLIDPAASQRSRQTGRPDIVEFAEYGVAAIPADNRVNAGIAMVREVLAKDRIRIFDTCKELVRQIERYQWKRSRREDWDDDKVKPLKKDDHLVDALRYIIASRPEPPDPASGLPPFIARTVTNPYKTVRSEFGPGFFGPRRHNRPPAMLRFPHAFSGS